MPDQVTDNTDRTAGGQWLGRRLYPTLSLLTKRAHGGEDKELVTASILSRGRGGHRGNCAWALPRP